MKSGPSPNWPLLAYMAGLPKASLAVDVRHELSVETVLRQIGEERRRRQIEASSAITIEAPKA